jgi:hypothetical protein
MITALKNLKRPMEALDIIEEYKQKCELTVEQISEIDELSQMLRQNLRPKRKTAPKKKKK